MSMLIFLIVIGAFVAVGLILFLYAWTHPDSMGLILGAVGAIVVGFFILLPFIRGYV